MVVIAARSKPIIGAFLMVLCCMPGACGDGGGSGAGADVPAGWQEQGEAGVFSIRAPEGWTVERDAATGRVVVQAPPESRPLELTVWPFFTRTSLGRGSAPTVARRLLSRAYPSGSWGRSSAAGEGLIRLGGRLTNGGNARPGRGEGGGATGGEAGGAMPATASLTWRATGKGSSGILYVVVGSEGAVADRADTLASILESFAPRGPRGEGEDGDGSSSMPEFVSWTDPNEGAFSARVPRGWSVEGGVYRPNLYLVQGKVEATSPDGRVFFYMGNTFPMFVEPNQTLAYAGIGPGGTYRDPSGNAWPVQYYAPGARFVTDYLLPQRHGDHEVVSTRDRPDLASRLLTIGINRYDAGEVEYRFRQGGVTYRGGVLCITTVLGSAVGRTWHVWRLYLLEAPEDRFAAAKPIVTRMAESFRIDPDWARMQQNISAEQSRILAEMGDAVSKTIDETYWAKQRVQDEIARRRSNANLNLVDVVDPGTGEEFSVESGSNYYWLDHRGNVVGTDTHTRPSIDFRELLARP